MRHQEQIKKELSRPAAVILFDMLRTFRPVEIDVLFPWVFPKCKHVHSRRKKQQYLGGLIAYANQILGRHDYKIVPGNPRGTYHIISTLTP